MYLKNWNNLPCTRKQLNLDIVLCCGQSFRWKKEDGIWIGIHKKRVWHLKQDDTHLWYRASTETDKNSTKRKIDKSSNSKKRLKLETNSKNTDSLSAKADEYVDTKFIKTENSTKEKSDPDGIILWDYFQLDVELDKLCKKWVKVDSHFAEVSRNFSGVRMLRQDPTENLFSFICSSNNNITRISGMVEKMTEKFGDEILKTNDKVYYSFPSAEKLAKSDTEDILRGLGFGYRAKYIHQAAEKVVKNGGERWLSNLRQIPYEEAHEQLTGLPGVGGKVADCVCMMSLDKTEAVPVDTHVWQIAARDYKIKELAKTKTLTKKSYKAIGDFFRGHWGEYTSWAMNFLFAADLKQFKETKK